MTGTARDLFRLFAPATYMEATGCLLRNSGLRKDSYTQLMFGGKMWLAHRLAWTLCCGEIPAGADILHSCDARACIMPSHLFPGDDFVNQQDRVAKARHAGVPWPQQGSANLSAKLADEQVLALRARYAKGGVSQLALAREIGVSQSLVSQIVNRRLWPHL